MATRFLEGDIWATITLLARKRPGHVAVAYCSSGARKLLPLKKGSVLVVDASDRALKSGQTDPRELMKFVKDGVQVHSAANLHAKVFVFGSTAVVGSTNISKNSKTNLIEGAVRLDDPRVAAACRAFILDQLGERLELPTLQRMKKIFHKPKGGAGGGSRKKPGVRRKGRTRVAEGRTLWAVPLESTEWDEVQHAAADAARPGAKQKINRRKEDLAEFCWEGRNVANRLRLRDQVIEVLTEGTKTRVFAPAHVVEIKRIRRKGKPQPEIIAFLARPKTPRTIDFKRFKKLLGRDGAWLGRSLDYPKRIRDVWQALAARQLWTTPTDA